MLIDFEHVAEHCDDITDAQMDKAHRIIDPITGEISYRVESASFDAEKYRIEYRVTYDAKGFHCTCKSGKHGFGNVRHRSGVDWHVRASVRRELEYRREEQTRQDAEARDREAREEAKRKQQERKRQNPPQAPSWHNPINETSYANATRAHLLLIGEQEADDATYARVLLAPGQPTRGPEVKRDMMRYGNREPFRLM